MFIFQYLLVAKNFIILKYLNFIYSIIILVFQNYFLFLDYVETNYVAKSSPPTHLISTVVSRKSRNSWENFRSIENPGKYLRLRRYLLMMKGQMKTVRRRATVRMNQRVRKMKTKLPCWILSHR